MRINLTQKTKHIRLTRIILANKQIDLRKLLKILRLLAETSVSGKGKIWNDDSLFVHNYL